MSVRKCISGFLDETKAWETVLILFMSHMLRVLTSFVQATLIAACMEKLPAFHNPFILSFSTFVSIHVARGMFGCQSLVPKAPLALQSPPPPPSLLGSWPFVFDPPVSLLHLTGLQLILRGMSEALIDKRVAPALITLCSGPELWVNRSYETL